MRNGESGVLRPVGEQQTRTLSAPNFGCAGSESRSVVGHSGEKTFCIDAHSDWEDNNAVLAGQKGNSRQYL